MLIPLQLKKMTLKDSSFIPLVQSDNNNYSLYLHQFLTVGVNKHLCYNFIPYSWSVEQIGRVSTNFE
jgi:hypothetical protein